MTTSRAASVAACREAPPVGPARLLLVVDSLEIGGAERYVVDLAAALHRRGVEVTVACSVTGALGEELAGVGVAVRPLSSRLAKRRFSPQFAAALRRLLRRERFDMVHAHLYASEVAAAAAGMGSRVPLVLTDHTEGPWRCRRANAASAWAYGRAAHVVAVSEAIRVHLLERFGMAPERVTYIPTAVVAAAATPARVGGTGRLTVGRVARLQPEKGIDVYLAAAAWLAPRFPDADFVIVGEGPLRGPLERLAARLGLADRVRFLGARDDARELIAGLDVLAVSSITDGQPLVVLEAMAAGVPVVGTAVGGIPRQIEHDRTGLLVPPGDAAALAAAVARLLREPAARLRLGAAAREHAAREFGHAALVERTQAVYQLALAGSSRGGCTGRPGWPAIAGSDGT
jgi:glycosyltransferase involved in cell wall biosynthesis